MVEYAEMMLDGTMCERCGCFIDEELPGHTRLCEDCFNEELKSAIK